MDEGRTYYSTTNIAFVFSNGIIAAADSRGSLSFTPDTPGKIITNTAIKIRCFKHFFSGIAGKASYCKECQRLLRKRSQDYEATHHQQIPILTAAQDVGNLFHGHSLDDAAECLLSGFEDGVEKIYHIKYDGEISSPLTMGAIGSGRNHALEILEKEYNKDMNVNTAIALARRAVTWSCIKDWKTGGIINVFYLDKNRNLHEESYETEMNKDLEEAEKARIDLNTKFERGDFDIGKLEQYVKYVKK